MGRKVFRRLTVRRQVLAARGSLMRRNIKTLFPSPFGRSKLLVGDWWDGRRGLVSVIVVEYIVMRLKAR